MIKIGGWIFDAAQGKITGAGMNTFLVSQNEFGDRDYKIETKLNFSNFSRPAEKQLGMNSGIIFGFNFEGDIPRYYNLLLTGSEILIERNYLNQSTGKRVAEHLTPGTAFPIEAGKTIQLLISVSSTGIQVFSDRKLLLQTSNPTLVRGRVGLRPWRSVLECLDFRVAELD